MSCRRFEGMTFGRLSNNLFCRQMYPASCITYGSSETWQSASGPSKAHRSAEKIENCSTRSLVGRAKRRCRQCLPRKGTVLVVDDNVTLGRPSGCQNRHCRIFVIGRSRGVCPGIEAGQGLCSFVHDSRPVGHLPNSWSRSLHLVSFPSR